MKKKNRTLDLKQGYFVPPAGWKMPPHPGKLGLNRDYMFPLQGEICPPPPGKIAVSAPVSRPYFLIEKL